MCDVNYAEETSQIYFEWMSCTKNRETSGRKISENVKVINETSETKRYEYIKSLICNELGRLLAKL
jgi:hypothetical protein